MARFSLILAQRLCHLLFKPRDTFTPLTLKTSFFFFFRLDTVAQACNLSYFEGKDQGMVVQGNARPNIDQEARHYSACL
jgi:hypothetical protein